ncbi:hypothetical protein FEM48_Zijuj02G0185900 [Ziziphus jujuba var. spinosa]|uniref:F-box domain-containing protein n=1 Tax=Ziziphus jujuba var. spinosa TaxID=714518 RepID=A0A978VXA9_ZIZJJ|nr:hypothetical protein FEM48_Zijuj02G0185900 [Ziziphus jujuba var. spinosa]
MLVDAYRKYLGKEDMKAEEVGRIVDRGGKMRWSSLSTRSFITATLLKNTHSLLQLTAATVNVTNTKRVGELKMAKGIHSWILVNGIYLDVVLENSVLDVYMKCGDFHYAEKLFETMENKDTVTWNIMIGAYMRVGYMEKALDLFRKLLLKDVASWNTIIDGLIQNGYERTALELLYEMVKVGPAFDKVTFSVALVLASSLLLLELGRQVHGFVLRLGIHNEGFIRSSLIDMYGKCGKMHKASLILRKTPQFHFGTRRSKFPDDEAMTEIISWSSLISGSICNPCFTSLKCSRQKSKAKSAKVAVIAITTQTMIILILWPEVLSFLFPSKWALEIGSLTHQFDLLLDDLMNQAWLSPLPTTPLSATSLYTFFIIQYFLGCGWLSELERVLDDGRVYLIMENISEDLLGEILGRIADKDAVRCKSVCKSWHRIISKEYFLLRFWPKSPVACFYIRTLKPEDRGPFNWTLDRWGYINHLIRSADFHDTNFVSFGTGQWHRQLYHDDGEGDGDDFLLLDCCNGLQLLFNSSLSQYKVYNPTTKQQSYIPKSHAHLEKIHFLAALAFDPTESLHYRVVRFSDPQPISNYKLDIKNMPLHPSDVRPMIENLDIIGPNA